jgi:hypothetical protein
MKCTPNTFRRNLFLGLAYLAGIALMTALARMH